MNPVIAPGDPVQFLIESAEPLELTAESKLPKGWQLSGQTSAGEGTQIVTVTTPGNTKQGNVDVELQFSDGTSIETRIAVVRQIGSH